MRRGEPSCTVGRNVNWYSHYGEQYRGSLGEKKKLKIELPYKPCNPTPGHISREKHGLKTYMHPNAHCKTIYNSQDMEATWTSINRGMDKEMWYIYIMEYYSVIKKEWNNSICNNIDGPRECHTECSKSDREGEISYDIPYMWNLKRNDTNELTKHRETHRL